MARPTYQYKRRTTEELDKRATQQGGAFIGALIDSAKVYKPRDGENWIRIMPPTWPDPIHYGFDLWMHEYFGPQNANAICLLKMQNSPFLPDGYRVNHCAIDDAGRVAEDEGDEEEAKQLRPRRKVLVYIVDMKDEGAGVQAWLMPWGLDKDITIVSRDRQTGQYYYIDDPDEGFDVFFDKTGSKIATKYIGASIARHPSRIKKPEWLDYCVAHPLPTMLQWRSNVELTALYGGDAPDQQERQQEARTSGRSERGPSREALEQDNGRRREEPEETRPTRGDSRDAFGATSRSESSEDVTARSETRTSRSERRPRDEEEARPTTRPRISAEPADTRMSTASADAQERPRASDSQSTGGDKPMSRAEQLKARFAKKAG